MKKLFGIRQKITQNYANKQKKEIAQSRAEYKAGKTHSIEKIKKGDEEMSYEITFTDTSSRQFRKLEKDVEERIVKALERIRLRPEHYVMKLIGDPGYRLRVGNYGVIFDIQKSDLFILVIKIVHRKNIYQN